MMEILFDPSSLADYEKFIQVCSLPQYRFRGSTAIVGDEYAARLFNRKTTKQQFSYDAPSWMYDYQAAITCIAIRKRKYCVFADCGLGKTGIILEFSKHCRSLGKRVLIVSPLMVIDQTLDERTRFYGDALPIEQVAARNLPDWLKQSEPRIGITNYDALTNDLETGGLGALILDESSTLKSQGGKWASICLRLGKTLDWKLACTGTPAPNDRIEFANHAVFMDAFPNVNSFLAKFFVNRGQTDNRWEMRPHALEPFYRALSHWCIFLANPGTYGWKDNATGIPPIHVHVHDVELTRQQQDVVMDKTGALFAHHVGGIMSRSTFGQLAKGNNAGTAIETKKPASIKALVDSWPGESTIIWCLYNDEQQKMAAMFPGCANITGDTPLEERLALIGDFKAKRRRILVSKPRIMGYGLNLQVATRHIFSGLQDSYESFYQAVKRSNRIGSTIPLNVHIPVTSIEMPMVQTVLEKAHRVQQDTETQERLFREYRF